LPKLAKSQNVLLKCLGVKEARAIAIATTLRVEREAWVGDVVGGGDGSRDGGVGCVSGVVSIGGVGGVSSISSIKRRWSRSSNSRRRSQSVRSRSHSL
jgi:hypothetical protein